MMKSVLREDTTIPNIQRQHLGQKKSEDLVKPNIVGNVLDSSRDNSTAPKIKPYPLDRVDNITTGVFIEVMNLMKILEIASNNPAISKKYSKLLKHSHIRLKKLGSEIVDISKSLDRIS